MAYVYCLPVNKINAHVMLYYFW